jgi:hypothetical protein
MAIKFTNNAFSTLASSINNSVTTISLAAGTGSRFPSLGTGDFFFATLLDASNNLEIVKVTARSGDTLTVTRGQDGTTGRSYAGGDRLELRPVAAVFDEFVQLDTTQTISGDKTFSGTNTFSNTITGSIDGNAGTVTNGVYTTGDQTIGGNKLFTGIVDFTDANHRLYVTGNDVLHVFDQAGGSDYFTFTRNTNAFAWVVDSVTQLALNSSGDLTATGNVTAYSDERLKSNIKTIDGALSSVNLLRGVMFTKDGKSGIGVIAQEVQKVIPEVVQENDSGYLSVAYGNLVGVLIEAVKELSAKVEALEAK